MKKTVKVLSLLFLFSMFFLQTNLVSAVSITAGFENSSACGFAAPGDLNVDGEVAADDLVMLKKIVIQSEKANYSEVYLAFGNEAKYSDVNGDEAVNVLDLVRLKKNLSDVVSFIESGIGVNESGGMNLNGNTAYVEDIVSSLDEDCYYKISYSYKSNSDIKVRIAGITDKSQSFVSPQSNEWKNCSHIIGISENLVKGSEIELQITGKAAIDNFSIEKVVIDNDLSEAW